MTKKTKKSKKKKKKTKKKTKEVMCLLAKLEMNSSNEHESARIKLMCSLNLETHAAHLANRSREETSKCGCCRTDKLICTQSSRTLHLL